ncbi:hypothetical protein LCGC14_1092090 [marine sediment metagenome]|uniref:Uncharacterized protein n=1 Tax=marine sediment metagenome TaxID=412755 RepID=A0A0F9MC56_9ZZZZ
MTNLTVIQKRILAALSITESIICQPDHKEEYRISVEADKMIGRKAECFTVLMDEVQFLVAEGMLDYMFCVTGLGAQLLRQSACKPEVKP